MALGLILYVWLLVGGYGIVSWRPEPAGPTARAAVLFPA